MVTAYALDGSRIQLADESFALHDELELRVTIDGLHAGEARRAYAGLLYLPNRKRNVDLCMRAWIDEPNPPRPGGEVRESLENDNFYHEIARFFPDWEGEEEADASTISPCYWAE